MTQKKSDFERACNYVARKTYCGKPVIILDIAKGTKVSYQTALNAVGHFRGLGILVPGPRLPSKGLRGAPAKQFVTRALASKLELQAKRPLNYING